MRVINMYDEVGSFGEDKDVAASIRQAIIKPSLKENQDLQINFSGVTLVTQSFIHALISDVLRTFGEEALDKIEFSNCIGIVKGIISTVVQYSLDSPSDEVV